MSRTAFGILCFAAGALVGALVVKEYARNTIAGDVAGAFSWLGLGAGTSQKIGTFVAGQAVD